MCSKSLVFDINEKSWVVEKKIGEGGFSFVYLVHERSNKQKKYAVKRMLVQTKEAMAAADKEIATHKSIKHPNVVELIGHSKSDSMESAGATDVCLLFPFYSLGSMFDILQQHDLKKPWPFHQEEALRIFKAICNGTKAIHEQGLSHRDIKPGNILFTGPSTDGHPNTLQRSNISCNTAEDFFLGENPLLKPTPVLIDLGSSGPLKVVINSKKEALQLQELAEEICTLPYRPPELHYVKHNCIIDDRADVWSLGCCLYALAFGHCPFEDKTQGVLKLFIMSGTVKFPTDNEYLGCQYDTEFCELIQRMLVADPVIRPTLDEVISWIPILQKDEDLPSHPSAKQRYRCTKAEIKAKETF